MRGTADIVFLKQDTLQPPRDVVLQRRVWPEQILNCLEACRKWIAPGTENFRLIPSSCCSRLINEALSCCSLLCGCTDRQRCRDMAARKGFSSCSKFWAFL